MDESEPLIASDAKTLFSNNFEMMSTGHNLSQTDANSTGGESLRNVGHTGTGCYKNHEHSMVQPSSQTRRQLSSSAPPSGSSWIPTTVASGQAWNPTVSVATTGAPSTNQSYNLGSFHLILL